MTSEGSEGRWIFVYSYMKPFHEIDPVLPGFVAILNCHAVYTFVQCSFRPRSAKKLKMVTIINGEIVQDNDPRAQEFRNRGRRQEQQQRQSQQQWSHSQNPPQEQQGGSIFDQLNNRLISAGFPRWNLGQNVVEPIVSVALILALVLFGIQGVLLVGVVWFIMQQSRQR